MELRREGRDPGGRDQRFQSPTHRDGQWNQPLSGPPPAHRVAFSPLLIGTVNGTPSQEPGPPGAGVAFQSPTHRDGQWNHRSPLAAALGGSSCFQSPTHRDGQWNYARVRAGCGGDEVLSVPYSSGRSMELPVTSQARYRYTTAFSPLLIGTVNGTSTAPTRRCRARLVFQSPTHRDGQWNDSNEFARVALPALFQSPTHRDGQWNPQRLGHQHPAADLSVPYSSGRSMERQPGWPQQHRRALSVPYSSGRSMERSGRMRWSLRR